LNTKETVLNKKLVENGTCLGEANQEQLLSTHFKPGFVINVKKLNGKIIKDPIRYNY